MVDNSCSTLISHLKKHANKSGKESNPKTQKMPSSNQHGYAQSQRNEANGTLYYAA